jgi:hypothetical protein
MKTPLAVATVLLSTISLAGENGNSLDRKLLGLLLNEAELVVHARMDTGGFVGDAATRARYGLVGPVQIACRMQLEDTVIGSRLEGATIEFLFSRSPGNERCFIPQGDYLLFLKRDSRETVMPRVRVGCW